MPHLRILGIDPGTATTGYGVLDKKGASPSLVDYGTIRTSPKKAPAERLLDIYNQTFAATKMNAYTEGDMGYFEILDCTHWDLLCKPLGIRCDENCEKHEGPSLLKALGDFTIEFIQCKPRGGDRCSYKITKK